MDLYTVESIMNLVIGKINLLPCSQMNYKPKQVT